VEDLSYNHAYRDFFMNNPPFKVKYLNKMKNTSPGFQSKPVYDTQQLALDKANYTFYGHKWKMNIQLYNQ
jgi:hypothetical protein